MTIRTKLQIAPVLLALTMGGCENMLVEEPKAFLTTESYYRTVPELEAGVQSGYAVMRQIWGGTWNQWWGPIGNMSDQEHNDPTEVTVAINNVDYLLWTAEQPSNTDVGWLNLYRLIYRMNVVLAREKDVTMTPGQRDAITGEAKLLRAYAYYKLDQAYSAGPKPTDLSVPLLLSEEAHAGSEFPRATSADVHAAIIKDLTEAEAALPTRTQRGTGGRGRATKGAAQMILADLYLWRSSFMLQNDWDKVAEWSKKVIDSGQYSLVQTGFFNVFNPGAKAANNENIFFLAMTGTSGRAVSGFVNVHYPRSLGFNTGGGFGTNQVTQWMLNSFARGDVRGSMGQNRTTTVSPADTFAYRNFACSTSASIGCRAVDPMPYKFRATNLNAGFGDVDVPFYRYAESLLMYAEAQNELGNTATAIQYINMVRARARRGSTGTENRAQPADLSPAMTKLQTREAIFMERNWELAHEIKRWWDLVRRDSQEPGYWAGQLTANEPRATARHANLGQRTFMKRFPVPQSQIDLNKVLVQNPGY